MRLFLPVIAVFFCFVLFACPEAAVVDDEGSNMGTGANAGAGGSGGVGGAGATGTGGAAGEGGNTGGIGGTGGVDCSNVMQGDGSAGEPCRSDEDCQEPTRCCTSFGVTETCGVTTPFCECI
jgi:hypothetical protein